jgi:hypothetical protein
MAEIIFFFLVFGIAFGFVAGVVYEWDVARKIIEYLERKYGRR